MSGGGGLGGTGRFPRIYGEGGSWGKQGFPHGSEPNASDGQSFEGLDIARARACDDVIGKLGPGRGLVPAERLAVVAHELLVERGLRPAGLVVGRRPEARGVGREGLVGEYELALTVDPELE